MNCAKYTIFTKCASDARYAEYANYVDIKKKFQIKQMTKYQIKNTKPNPPDQTCHTKPNKQNLPNQNCQIKPKQT